MMETQGIRDMLDLDPMEQLKPVQPLVNKFKERLQVTSCSRVQVGSDHSLIHATVSLTRTKRFQLHFRYERKPRSQGVKGCHIWFSIEISENCGPRQNLLIVQVWAPEGVPSTKGPAVCINQRLEAEEDEEDWSDIDENEAQAPVTPASETNLIDSPPKPQTKKQKTSDDEISSTLAENQDPSQHSDEGEDHDSFMVFLDPDVLGEFLDKANLSSLDEGTAFFLLMTFPFYEHEWDIVGYVLEVVFGGEDEKDDESTDS